MASACVAPVEGLDGIDGANVDEYLVLDASLLGAGFAPNGDALLVTTLERQTTFVSIVGGDQRVSTRFSPTLDVVRVAPADGGWLVAGGFSREWITPDGTLLTPRGGFDAVVMRTDEIGNVRWTRQLAGVGDTFVNGVAEDELGRIFVAGRYAGGLRVGDEQIAGRGSDDGYVARLDADGDAVWLRAIAGEGRETIGALAISPTLGVLVSGSYENVIEVGDETLGAPPSRRPFIVELGGDGDVRTLRPFEATGNAQIAHLASGDASIWAAGSFDRTLTFGGTSMRSRGQTDIFVARLDLDLDPIDATRFGGAQLDVVESIDVGPFGHLWLAGTVRGENRLAGGSWNDGDGADAFVGAVSERLGVRRALRFGGTDECVGGGVGVSQERAVSFVTEGEHVRMTVFGPR